MEPVADPIVGGVSLTATRLSDVDLRLVGLLDEAERRMAAGFSSAQRDRFLSGRILLRLHAAKLGGAARGSLRADYYCPTCGTQGNNVHGIPRYKLSRQGFSVRLSLSRAENWCLLAGSAEANIIRLGVDVQEVSSTNFEGFETVALTSVERNLVRQATTSTRVALMARLWVRKEAVLKALGCGLVVDPSTVDVSGSAPVIRGQSVTPNDWLIADMHPTAVGLPDKYVAALALLRAPAPNYPHIGRSSCTN